MQRVFFSQQRCAIHAVAASILALGGLSVTPRFQESNVAEMSLLLSTADASAARATFQVSANLPEHSTGSIAGRSTGATERITLTALRYARFSDATSGEHRVVTHFANLLQETPGPFEITGLPSGLWVVSACAEDRDQLLWGRSDPIWIEAGGLGGGASIEMERYGVSVRINGVPPSQMDQASLSLEWVQGDRVQAEASDFLDAPVLPGPGLGDSASFGSLEQVGTPWLAGVEDLSPSAVGNPTGFDVGQDPFGLARMNRSWMAPLSEGPTLLPVPGPGLVTVRLNRSPGLWNETLVTVELKRGSGVTCVTLQPDGATAELHVEPCRTALAASSSTRAGSVGSRRNR
ncbi:MAG: hypothetical protein AAGG01_02835 [Planctomycetota bacterium]